MRFNRQVLFAVLVITALMMAWLHTTISIFKGPNRGVGRPLNALAMTVYVLLTICCFTAIEIIAEVGYFHLTGVTLHGPFYWVSIYLAS
jgi:hypothetical protein